MKRYRRASPPIYGRYVRRCHFWTVAAHYAGMRRQALQTLEPAKGVGIVGICFRSEGSAMGSMMTAMMAWMGVSGLLLLIVLILVVAAAVKYLFFDHRQDH